MLNANISKIKSELGRLNEQQIPDLKQIENEVNIIESQNMQMKTELNDILDNIEAHEQALIEKLENSVRQGLTPEAVASLFSK